MDHELSDTATNMSRELRRLIDDCYYSRLQNNFAMKTYYDHFRKLIDDHIETIPPEYEVPKTLVH